MFITHDPETRKLIYNPFGLVPLNTGICQTNYFSDTNENLSIPLNCESV